MSDVFSKAKRSDVMSRISGRGNKATEIEFLKLLRRHRVSGWRRHLPVALATPIAGSRQNVKRRSQVKPDFVFRRLRIAVFIDGCFWHGCPIHGTKPSANAEFWRNKLVDNQARDRYVTKALRRQKWTVLRFWEHQLSQGGRVMARLQLCFARAASPEL
jgi:DNA mismatch endonuclease (patch repair protein)